MFPDAYWAVYVVGDSMNALFTRGREPFRNPRLRSGPRCSWSPDSKAPETDPALIVKAVLVQGDAQASPAEQYNPGKRFIRVPDVGSVAITNQYESEPKD